MLGNQKLQKLKLIENDPTTYIITDSTLTKHDLKKNVIRQVQKTVHTR